MVVSMLEGAVSGELGTGKLAALPGVRVAGKTGTGDMGKSGDADRVYASFIGSVIDREPRFVALVGVLSARDGVSGPSVAAPAFGRLVARILSERAEP
jgi:cell division protein FtsI (penicillin-binding protein 3)